MTHETRTEVILYLVLTLGISCSIMFLYAFWPEQMRSTVGDFKAGHFMYILMVAGAPIAAFGLSLWREGWAGVKNLLFRYFYVRVGLKWWLIALFGIPAMLLLFEVLAEIFGKGKPGLELERWYIALPLFFVTFGPGRMGPVLEEFGWRGYLLPRLLESMSPLRAGVFIGFFWGLLHMPLALIPWMSHAHIDLGAFFITIVFLSIIMNWLYIHTRGSVLLSGVLPHALVPAAGVAGISGSLFITLGLIVFGLIYRYGESLGLRDTLVLLPHRTK